MVHRNTEGLLVQLQQYKLVDGYVSHLSKHCGGENQKEVEVTPAQVIPFSFRLLPDSRLNSAFRPWAQVAGFDSAFSHTVSLSPAV
jgi:hypothetical protein